MNLMMNLMNLVGDVMVQRFVDFLSFFLPNIRHQEVFVDFAHNHRNIYTLMYTCVRTLHA